MEDLDKIIGSSKICCFIKNKDDQIVSYFKSLLDEKRLHKHAKFIELTQRLKSRGMDKLLEVKTLNRENPLYVFINGRYLGDDVKFGVTSGKFRGLLTYEGDEHEFDFDLLVIGGGSGGLAASKEAARFGRKVAVCDYVVPTPRDVSWGLGGTCVNVGCIPKKLMHQAALLGEKRREMEMFGWPNSSSDIPNQIDWQKLILKIQNHIKSLNWSYKVTLRDKRIKYFNALAVFEEDNHTVKLEHHKGKEETITAKDIIICVGGRPKYLNIPGAKEFGITSDDLFSLPQNPGKTLIIGGGYIALECAGFLNAIIDDEVTVMFRSVLLREFDQQMAGLIMKSMEEKGVKFVKGNVTKLDKNADSENVRVEGKLVEVDEASFEQDYKTVIFAVGREAQTTNLGLNSIGVEMNPKNGKILERNEQTNVNNVYAVGDALSDKVELTPVAIQAGILLARRICRVSEETMDYDCVPTVIFSSVEYGCVGLSEEKAIDLYKGENVEVYHQNIWPLEWTVVKRPENQCYCKLICVNVKGDEHVVGLHYFGPNAGEVVQGYAGMLRMKATKKDFDRLIGVHPTTAETFTSLSITKSSGQDPAAKGC